MTEHGTMYAQLARPVRAAGQLERRPASYAARISPVEGLLGGLNLQIEHATGRAR